MKKYLIIRSDTRDIISDSDDLKGLVMELIELEMPFNVYYYIIDSKDLKEERFSCLYSRINQYFKNTKD